MSEYIVYPFIPQCFACFRYYSTYVSSGHSANRAPSPDSKPPPLSKDSSLALPILLPKLSVSSLSSPPSIFNPVPDILFPPRFTLVFT